MLIPSHVPIYMWSPVLVHEVSHWLGCIERLVPTVSRRVRVFYQRLWTINIPFSCSYSLIFCYNKHTGQSTFINLFREHWKQCLFIFAVIVIVYMIITIITC